MKKIGVLLVIGFMIVACNPLNAAAIDYRPFFDAVQAGNVDELKRFWEENRDMNIEKRDCFGNTPLHVASFMKRKECVELLLNYGADKEVKNNNGKTAAESAKDFGYDDIATLIESHQDLLEIKEPDME